MLKIFTMNLMNLLDSKHFVVILRSFILINRSVPVRTIEYWIFRHIDEYKSDKRLNLTDDTDKWIPLLKLLHSFSSIDKKC